MTSLTYNKTIREHEVEGQVYNGFVNPKFTAWTCFLPPINSDSTVFFYEPTLENSIFDISILAGHAIILCTNLEIAQTMQSRLSVMGNVYKFSIIVASAVYLPFKIKTIDLIIARNFFLLWNENRSKQEELCSNLLSLLVETGTAIIGCRNNPVVSFSSYAGNILKSFLKKELKFHSIICSQFKIVQSFFYCMPSHIAFDEIIYSEWKRYRQSKAFSLRQAVKNLIINCLFPYGAPSINYILQWKRNPSLLQLILEKFFYIFGDSCNELKVYQVLIGNPCTIICLVAIGPQEFVIRIPRTPDALARVERQFETLCYLQSTFNENTQEFRFPKAYQPYEVSNQAVFVEGRLRGKIIDNASCLNRSAENSAVQWLIDFHLTTQRVVENKMDCLQDLVDAPFQKLFSCLRTAQEKDIFLTLQSKLLQALAGLQFKTVCMHGDYKIENMIFSKVNKILGVFDWDLSRTNGLPIIDLLFFIAFNEQLKYPNKLITEIFFEKFYQYKVHDYEDEFIRSYINIFKIDMHYVKYFCIIAWVYNIVYRNSVLAFNLNNWYKLNITDFLFKLEIKTL